MQIHPNDIMTEYDKLQTLMYELRAMSAYATDYQVVKQKALEMVDVCGRLKTLEEFLAKETPLAES